jgi:hypothetical protein
MNSTTDPKAIEPNDVLVARADERLAHAYDQIARADQQLARLNEHLAKLEHDAAHQPSAVVGHRPPRGRPALRGFIGLLLALCVFVGAFVSQSSYGDAARLIVARWAPQFVATSSLPMEKPDFPAQPSSTAQVAAATPVLPQPTPSAQTAPQDVAPPAAPMSPEVTQLLQSMARDLATAGQGIEQLKAGQEQMTRDNASIAEQLKASQEQVARVIAKVSEQELRPKISAPPPRLAATPARKPAPPLPSRQDTARPQATTQQVQEPQMSSTPRSLMPAR